MILATKSPNPILHLQELTNIATKANNNSIPSIAFFNYGSRNVLFKIESLFRIYRSISDKNYFEPLYQKVKHAEDELGKYDFHNWMFDKVKNNKELPKTFKEIFEKRLKIAEIELNEFLKKENWLDLSAAIYTTKLKELIAFNWPTSQEFNKSLSKFLLKQIEKINKEYDEGEFDPNKIENGIHELRRKIRWISIYASNVEGFVQLIPNKTENVSLKEYLTPEIVNSPFNKLPSKPKGILTIQIQKQYFYTLSWIIAELGKLKDEGLFKLEIENILKENTFSKEEQNSIRKCLNIENNFQQQISDKAKILIHDFFKKHFILDHIAQDIENSEVN